mgnify:FL=1
MNAYKSNTIEEKIIILTNGVSVIELKPFIRYFANKRIVLILVTVLPIFILILNGVSSIGIALTSPFFVKYLLALLILSIFPILFVAILFNPDRLTNNYQKNIKNFIEEKNIEISESTFIRIVDCFNQGGTDQIIKSLNEMILYEINMEKMEIKNWNSNERGTTRMDKIHNQLDYK